MLLSVFSEGLRLAWTLDDPWPCHLHRASDIYQTASFSELSHGVQDSQKIPLLRVLLGTALN